MGKDIYYLMNKDSIVLEFYSQRGGITGNTTFKESISYGEPPLGFEDIDSWVNNRNAGKHNSHIREILINMNCNDNESYVQVTHAASINDTFWVKAQTENVQWKDISLYRNQFTEMISTLAFEGIGLSTTFSPITPKYSSPELAVEGSFRRCFRKEDTIGEFGSDIFLYKRGSEKLNHEDGIEHYGEILASEIAKFISGDNAVGYSLATIDEKTASRCNLFTNESVGLAPLHKVIKKRDPSLDDIFDFYVNLGCEQQFREMLMLDALCFNVDRHLGNLGVLFDNDSLEILRIAPIYDLNWSLLPSFSVEDLESPDKLGDKLIDQLPRIGDDFTHLGHLALNDKLLEKLHELQDFTFSFRGNDEFPAQRVKLLEHIVQKQASAILSQDKIYTKDVFFSPKQHKADLIRQEAIKASQTIESFADILNENGFLTSLYENDSNASVFVSMENEPDIEANIDFLKGTIQITYKGKDCDMKAGIQDDKTPVGSDIYEFYSSVVNQLYNFLSGEYKEYLKAFADNGLFSDSYNRGL